MVTVLKIRSSIVLQLLAINIVVFILQQIIPGLTSTFMVAGLDSLARPWTLFTAMFLHGSFVHLLFNMYVLFMFGPLVEQALGRTRFLYLYFASGLLASLAAVFFYDAAVGASGALMGVIGAVIVFFPHLKVLFFFVIPMSMRTAGIIFAAIDLFGTFNPSSTIAHWAHLAGLGSGVLYSLYLKQKAVRFKKAFSARSKPFSQPKRTSSNKYEDTIELSKDDLDRYYKYGRL